MCDNCGYGFFEVMAGMDRGHLYVSCVHCNYPVYVGAGRLVVEISRYVYEDENRPQFIALKEED